MVTSLEWSLPARPARCRVLSLGRMAIAASWRHHLCDPFWRIYRNRQRGARIDGRGWTHDLVPTALHVLPAWVECRGACDGTVDHFYVHCEPMGLTGAAVRRYFQQPWAISAPALVALADHLAEAPPDPANHLRLAGFVDLVVAESLTLLPASGRRALAQRLEADDPCAPAIEAVRADLTRRWPVADLAGCCAMGVDHFARTFRHHHGCAPAAWVREQRVRAAAEHLLAGDDPVEEVAQVCGFTNRYHFSRVFARITGQPPAAYRRRRPSA